MLEWRSPGLVCLTGLVAAASSKVPASFEFKIPTYGGSSSVGGAYGS